MTDCLLFTYGSLSNPARQHEILSRDCNNVSAVLHDFIRKQGRWPYIVPSPGDSVVGSLLTDLSEADLHRLDVYEVTEPRRLEQADRQLYSRVRATVISSLSPDPLRCWVYQPHLIDWPDAWKE